MVVKPPWLGSGLQTDVLPVCPSTFGIFTRLSAVVGAPPSEAPVRLPVRLPPLPSILILFSSPILQKDEYKHMEAL